ncbi:MAG: S8 family serine peptidase [Streptosporangiaceae bacterium]
MPRRFPPSLHRPAMAVLAIGLASAWLGAAGPAQAAVTGHSPWWFRDLGVTRGWQATRGSGVVVAVLSDGVDSRQPDLTGSVITGPDLTGSAGRPAQPYYAVQGTEAASLIAGHGHGPGGKSGLTGVAPQARILSVRVTLTSDDPSLAEPAVRAALPGAIAAGIHYAVRHGATVILLPLDPGLTPGANPAPATSATPAPTPSVAPTPDSSPAEQAAVSYARRAGAVLVAPAGDNAASSNLANYPAAYPGVLAVGAVGPDFALVPTSVMQPYVALTAPGTPITAAVPPAAAASGYTSVSSTTAASALVAGVAALIRSRFPTLPAAKVDAALTGSTLHRPATVTAGLGAGTVSAARALVLAGRLAGPAPRAGAGAQPLRNPSPPAVRPAAAVLRPRLRRYAISCAALLAGLVLLVLVFALLRWLRRRRAAAAQTTDWPARDDDRVVYGVSTAAAAAGPALPTVGQAGTAAAARSAAGPRGTAGPRIVPASWQPGTGPAPEAGYRRGAEPTAAPAGTEVRSGSAGIGGWPSSGLAGPGLAGPGAAGSRAAAADDTGAHGSLPGLGSLARPVSRRPKISGAPPWDPAPPPGSELSWTSVPIPPPSSGPPPLAASWRGSQQGGEQPVFAAAPVSPWRADRAGEGGPDETAGSRDEAGSAAAPDRGPAGPWIPAPTAADAGPGAPGSDQAFPGWDPGDVTEAFPAVPREPD